jgi:guanylate kinase
LTGNSTGRLHHAKSVRISAPFDANLYQRCIHSRDDNDESTHEFVEVDETDIEAQTEFQKLATNAIGLLQQLKAESLKSFRSDTIS